MRPFDKDSPIDLGDNQTQMFIWCILKRYVKKEGLPLGTSEFKRFVGNIGQDLGLVSASQQTPLLFTIMYTVLEDLVADLRVDLNVGSQSNSGPVLIRQSQKQ